MNEFSTLLESLCTDRQLSSTDAQTAFELIMSGQVDDILIGSFLVALRTIGETSEIITAGAKVLRSRLIPVLSPAGAIDTCGTGGDSKGSFNISTATAIVAAGAGAIVAKHGNKALSSKSGSSEVLEKLGVKLQQPEGGVAACMQEANIGFMFAPAHHAAMKYAAPARTALGMRTIFNLLGPLSNPAGTKRQLLGVFDRKWTEPMAHTLRNLGAQRAWVVCGDDGMDELTTTTTSQVTELKDGQIKTFSLDPQQYGLHLVNPNELAGGGPQENAAAITALLAGQSGAFRDIVLLNTGAALLVADLASDLHDGITQARQSIDQGRAASALAKLVNVSNREAS
ncbi:MAG: anthranilate phosphoribosyltransferase [Robiginitomaculum sp.]|nr:MAG: anthranilate phosphoribosyltransferase [Robiginitomaculum sp.]